MVRGRVVTDQRDDRVAAAAMMIAVDAITQPSVAKLDRDQEAVQDGRRLLEMTIAEAVAVAAVRRSVLTVAAQTRRHAETPSLWDRASDALGVGLEGGARSTLAGRSPVDIDLMEIRGIIRETVIHDLVERRVRIKKTDTVPQLLRRLAAYIKGREPDQLWWYEYRFAQWARLLETYLRAVLEQPKSIRLLNTACTECGTRQVRVEAEDGHQLVPALVAEFRDGVFRAIVCGACAATTWRGDDLETLAAKIASQPRLLRSGTEDGRVVANG